MARGVPSSPLHAPHPPQAMSQALPWPKNPLMGSKDVPSSAAPCDLPTAHRMSPVPAQDNPKIHTVKEVRKAAKRMVWCLGRGWQDAQTRSCTPRCQLGGDGETHKVGGVPGVTATTEDPKEAKGRDSPTVSHQSHCQLGRGAVFYQPSWQPREGDRSPCRSPRGLQVCQAMAMTPSVPLHGHQNLPQTPPSPNNTLASGSDPSLPALESQRGMLPLCPQRVPFIRWVSKRSETSTGSGRCPTGVG